MKTRIFFTAIAITSLNLFFSCKDDPELTVDLEELGTSDCKIGYVGSDLHIQAEVVAEEKIDNITVEIHPEGDGLTWEFDSVFTEFSGLKNTTFHKHIDIPSDVDTGDYHFHLIVTDLEGNQTSAEEDLSIQKAVDTVAPEITVSSAPTSGDTFNTDDVISISGTVEDDEALGGLYIGMVRTGQSLEDSDVNATNTIAMLHTHDFADGSSYSFSASITVGATEDNNITPNTIEGDIAWQSTNYYIVVKCKDAEGNRTFSDHYSIVINVD